MDITKKMDGTSLQIQLNGRLDTTTAPQLQETVGNLEGVTSLELDMKDLAYVSSAGLRVLLAFQKTMNEQGKMVLRNVCDEVYEVFEITGFSDILTIEK